MAQDIFLKIAGIDGESQDAAHKNEIDVGSWEWQVLQEANMQQGSGGGSGKATDHDGRVISGSATGVPGRMAEHPHVVTQDALVHEGLGSDQGLLPQAWNTWHGHNLLHEYFACPSRFYFLALRELAPGLSRIQGKEAEVVVLLTQDTTRLRGLVDEDQFALFCTPVVNLFERRTDRIETCPAWCRATAVRT